MPLATATCSFGVRRLAWNCVPSRLVLARGVLTVLPSAPADRAIWLRGPAKGDGVVTHDDIAWVADYLGVQDSQWCPGTVDASKSANPRLMSWIAVLNHGAAAPHVGRSSAQARPASDPEARLTSLG